MDYDNITDDDLDNAFDIVSPTDDSSEVPDDFDDDFDDDNTDDTDFDANDFGDDDDQDYEYVPSPDDITDEEMAADGIEEDDFVVVNNDGSYVVIPAVLAELLMSDPDFVSQMDDGFDDVDDFINTIQPILNNFQDDQND